MSFIHIVIHHTLHKTNNILSKVSLVFSKIGEKSLLTQTGPRLRPESRRENYLKDRPSCPPTTGPRLRPESRRENYLNDHPRCPPTTDPGLIPEARQESLSEQSQVILR